MRFNPQLPLARQNKARTFADEIADNVSNKCTFMITNYPWTSRVKNELQYKWVSEWVEFNAPPDTI